MSVSRELKVENCSVPASQTLKSPSTLCDLDVREGLADAGAVVADGLVGQTQLVELVVAEDRVPLRHQRVGLAREVIGFVGPLVPGGVGAVDDVRGVDIVVARGQRAALGEVEVDAGEDLVAGRLAGDFAEAAGVVAVGGLVERLELVRPPGRSSRSASPGRSRRRATIRSAARGRCGRS